MLRVMAHPDEWEGIYNRIASATTSSVYGWPALDSKSHFIRHIQEFVAYISQAAVPGAYLVDAFPIMKHILREGLKWHEKESRLLAEYVDDIAEKNAAGSPQNGFVSGIMGSENQFGLSKKEITWLSATLFSVVLTSCVLALLHYPDVMRKAQAELDAVDDSPYTQAVVREILRWRPPAPLGLPHAMTEDSWFKGYFIPKGSFVLANVWDSSVYADPDVFRPGRFLDFSGKLQAESASGTHNGHSTFGFGKRICPGNAFCRTGTLHCNRNHVMGIRHSTSCDEKGNEWVDASIVVRPASFECKFSPRFPGVQGVLEASLSAG
ncbi:cytochrome P450 [Irpex lacteus]|nr:cytochrome P450 [Irpex lacteus]